MIGIDEHSIHQRSRFTATIMDLSNHRIYDVVEDKSLAQVKRILKRYKDKDKV